MNQTIFTFPKGRFLWVSLFLLLISCLFCMDSYASSSAASSPSKTNLFESEYEIPDFPVDSDRPFHFIAYYPSHDRYVLIQSDKEPFLEYDDRIAFKYLLVTSHCDYRQYEWYPEGVHSWSPTTYNPFWAWYGYGGCDSTTYYHAKIILYSNFPIYDTHNNNFMFYRTPFISGLTWQWVFSNFIQCFFKIIFPVLKGLCLLLLAIYCLVRLVRALLFFFKERR